MSNDLQDDADLRRFIQRETHRLREKTEAERRALIHQAIEQAMRDDVAAEREESERTAAAIRDELTREDPRQEARRARRSAPTAILLLFMLLLIIWLIAAATGRTDVIPFPGGQPPPAPTLQPRFGAEGPAGSAFAMAMPSGAGQSDMPSIGSMARPAVEIGAHFRTYYQQHDGLRLFGLPISPELQSNGRTFQWFERARLEQWPEYAGTPYAIQGGRIGVEFTKGINFPKQSFFVSRPDARYFAETGHGVIGRFWEFWQQNGGLAVFGYPISDQVQEVLPDKQLYTVQYFERGRIEHHPQQAGTSFEMQPGLLGRALYLRESKPHIIPPPQPTPMPVQ